MTSALIMLAIFMHSNTFYNYSNLLVRMRIRLQLLANQNWRSNGCYQSLACAPGSGYENDCDEKIHCQCHALGAWFYQNCNNNWVHSQKRHRLAASCGFYRLAASLSTSCSNLVNFIKLQQVCENQTCCNLIFADLLQVVETTCIKLANIKSQLSNCIKPVDNLQQTCYRQA